MIDSSRRAAQLEPLESRRLLAAAAGAVLALDGTLTVTGTAGNDDIILIYHQNVVILNGTTYAFPSTSRAIQRSVVNCLGGNDHVEVQEDFAHASPVTLNLGAGNDTALLSDAAAAIVAGSGNDTVVIEGFIYLDSFSDAGGVDTLDLTDQLHPGLTLDMNQYPGLENVIGARGNVIGNALNNYITLSDDDWGHTVQGNGGNDTLVGSYFADNLDGGAGNDTIVDAFRDSMNETRADTFIGGSGNDTIDYLARIAPLYVDLKSNPGIGGEEYENDSLIGVENALGTAILDGAGHLTITGTPGNDEISIRGGDDAFVNHAEFDFGGQGVIDGTVKCLGGDDVVYFIDLWKFVADLGAGNDVLELYDSDGGAIGGPGNDVVRPHYRGSYDSFDGGSGIDTIDLGYSDFDVFHNVYLPSMPTVENVLWSNDVTGNALNNYISLSNLEYNNELVEQYVAGGGGNDTVVGSDGPLYFDGGSGDDVASYVDTFVGGSGSDTIDCSAAIVPVLADLAQGTVRFDGDTTGPQLTGVENAIGGSANDTLIGDRNRNVLVGGAGNDTITGGGGKDVLIGGEGNDLFLARDGKRDVVIGGDGVDSGVLDRKDWRAQVEQLLA